MRRRVAGAVAALAIVLGLVAGMGLPAGMPVAAAAQEFRDVPASHEHRTHIEWLANRAITTGYPDGTFHPGESVSRAAFAAFLYRMAGRPNYVPPRVSPFRDVPGSHQFYKEISWLASVGVTTGWDLGAGVREFRPEAKITRDAMAAFMYRYACEPDFAAPATPPFRDTPVGRPFYREIAWMKATGLSTGWSDGTYRPMAQTQRAAVAAFLHRYSDRGFRSIPRCIVSVNPQAPAFSDKDGAFQDTFTIPKVEGVDYTANGKKVGAGTHKVADYASYGATHEALLDVAALAADDVHELTGETRWSARFDGRLQASAQSPTLADKDGMDSDVFTIPKATGVEYQVAGKPVVSGTYKVADYAPYENYQARLRVTAVAADGYRLTGEDAWTLQADGRKSVRASAVAFADRNGIPNDTFTVPEVAGVAYVVNGKAVKPGTHKVADFFSYGTAFSAVASAEATAEPGYKLEGESRWSATFDGIMEVTVPEPETHDEYGLWGDTLALATVEGVSYRVAGGQTLKPGGTYDAWIQLGVVYNHGEADFEIEAVAAPGYRIAGTDTWKRHLTAVVCPEGPTFDDPDGSEEDRIRFETEEGVTYWVDGRELVDVYDGEGNVTPGAYSNHHRKVSVQAHPLGAFRFDPTCQVHYFHTFTDGVDEPTAPLAEAASDFGNYTTAEAKQLMKQWHERVGQEIEDGSDYSQYSTFADILGTDYAKGATVTFDEEYTDAVKEINRRFNLRFKQRLDDLRATVGLPPEEMARLTDEQDASLYLHAKYTWDKAEAGQWQHWMNDPNLLRVVKADASAPGHGYAESAGHGENLHWSKGFDARNPEELADLSIHSYVGEWPYLDWSAEELAAGQERGEDAQNGHLKSLISANYAIQSSYAYIGRLRILPVEMKEIGGVTFPDKENLLIIVDYLSAQTPGYGSLD